MSPRRENEEEDVYATVRKSRKKKRTVSDERASETNPGMSSPALTDTDRSMRSRRSDRRASRSMEDISESQQPDSTPQRKKRKKKNPGSDLSPRRSLPRQASDSGQPELDGSALSVAGSRRKLTFSSGTNGSVRHIFAFGTCVDSRPTSYLPLYLYILCFDKVPHKRLIHKLKYYGITSPISSWIESFLAKKNSTGNK